MGSWLREVAELVHSGRLQEAIALVRARAAVGDVAATARLAVFGDQAGLSRAEADAVVDRAEEMVLAEDSDAHWVLYGAYEIRLGTCEYDEKARRSLRHLQRYAELTSSADAAYAVAVRCCQGDVGSAPDPLLADAWMERAANLGNPLAKRFVAGRNRRA